MENKSVIEHEQYSYLQSTQALNHIIKHLFSKTLGFRIINRQLSPIGT